MDYLTISLVVAFAASVAVTLRMGERTEQRTDFWYAVGTFALVIFGVLQLAWIIPLVIAGTIYVPL